jgi:two-component sensor histidine kinase
MPEPGAQVDASAYVRELCHSLSCSRLAQERIRLVLDERPIALSAEQCWFLGMIIYELVNNAARHAFSKTGGEICVAAACTGKLVECRVSDDGTAPANVRRGRGLEIVNNLALRLGGRFDQQFMPSGSASRLVFRASNDH